MNSLYLILSVFIVLCALVAYSESTEDSKDAGVDPEKLEYAKGSLCRYCDYCKVGADCGGNSKLKTA